MEEPLYKIEEECTTGWEESFTSLTKEQAKEKYEYLLYRGVNPDRIKITRIR